MPKNEGGMGFKELRKFNDAMLAKQVWQLVHDKESLFYRVFKAKFFPSDDIFSAQVKLGILKTRYLIAEGARYRVGNGQTIRIYQDRWLPGDGLGKVISPPSLLSVDARVADIIDADLGWWNVYLLERVFLLFEAQKIKSIPLCLIPQEDTLVWPKTKDGQYSVKLGYQLLCAKELSGSTLGSSNEVNRRMWSGLWRLKVPNKVKTFAWRACSESFPTMVNLARRRVVLSNSCTSCNREPESVIRALWGCEKVKGAWVLTLMSCGV